MWMQGPVHAALPFPDPKRHYQDLAASQALQAVPGTLAASRAMSATVAGSMRVPKQAQHAQHGQQASVVEEEVADDLDEPASPGQSTAKSHTLTSAC